MINMYREDNENKTTYYIRGTSSLGMTFKFNAVKDIPAEDAILMF